MSDLGPITERRFAEAFATAAVITAKAAAELIGLDEKTLASLSDRQVIRWVQRGKLRAYTERDLRAYLIEGPDAPCQSTSRPRAASGSSISYIGVGGFTDLRASRPDAQRKRSNGSSGSKPRKAG
jgi:hypothetical protein